MPGTDEVSAWLTRYVDVWRAGDHGRVSELFTDDAVYHTDAFKAPKRGHAEIAEYWRQSGDPPDGFEARFEPLAIRDDLAVVTGYSRYFNADRTAVDKEYGNVFVLLFGPDGRCREYREWYMLRGGDSPSE